MKANLEYHNERVREWADRQPPKYRKTALAFGYRCDTETCSFQGTLDWVSRLSRRYGYGVSRRTLASHLKDFVAAGVIKAESRRNGDKQAPSVYCVDFGAAIGNAPVNDPWVSDDDMRPVDSLRSVAPDDDDDLPESGESPEPDLERWTEHEQESTGDWRDILRG